LLERKNRTKGLRGNRRREVEARKAEEKVGEGGGETTRREKRNLQGYAAIGESGGEVHVGRSKEGYQRGDNSLLKSCRSRPKKKKMNYRRVILRESHIPV